MSCCASAAIMSLLAFADLVVQFQADSLSAGGRVQSSVHVRVGFDGDEQGICGQVSEVGTYPGPDLDDPVG